MGEHYDHLTLEERCTIAQLRQAGQPQCQIAAALGRSPSSISRELKRNSGTQVGDKPSYAHEQTRARRWTGSRLERDAELRSFVLDRLEQGWSPEQIAGRLKQQKAGLTISHESIYRFIYAQIRRTNDGAWRNYLPRRKHKRGRPGRKKRPPMTSSKAVSPSLCGLRPSTSAVPSATGKATSWPSLPPGRPSSWPSNASAA